MKLVDRLKEYFNKEEEVEVIPEESVYERIHKILTQYREEILPEVEKLKGHTHFLKTETEEKILKLIEEDPSCLTELDNVNENLGMFAAKCKLDQVVLRCLDDEEASTQQDDVSGKNIGMYAAENGLGKVVLKALDNDKASLQQEKYGRNIGIMKNEINSLEYY